MHKVPDISYMVMHSCSLLPLMSFPYLNSTASSLRLTARLTSFFSDSPCSPEVVDKMALLGTGVFRKHP